MNSSHPETACCVPRDPAASARMCSYTEALAEILAATPEPQAESVSIADALGRILAADLIAPASLPPFDNAAMDGFALALERDAEAGAEFVIQGEQAAGDVAREVKHGVEIMTGARLPGGVDSVVPVEHTETMAGDGSQKRIRLLEPVRVGQHVRRAGEDVQGGDPLMPRGTLIGTEQRSLATALGVAELSVARRPRLAVLSTGRELVDDPRQPLQSGQIRNSNRPYLQARAVEAGAQLVLAETVSDDSDAFLAALDRALAAGAECIVSTGAVSMGRYDFIPDALARRGADIRFHKCRIRPGKPILFAVLPGGALYFGLPGNPISAAVGFRFFVEPALRQRLGMPPERPIRLAVANSLKGKPPLRMHLKGRVEVDAEGRLLARILPGQESFRMRPLLDSNAWLVVEEDRAAPQAGERIDVFSACHLFPLSIGATGAGGDSP